MSKDAKLHEDDWWEHLQKETYKQIDKCTYDRLDYDTTFPNNPHPSFTDSEWQNLKFGRFEALGGNLLVVPLKKDLGDEPEPKDGTSNLAPLVQSLSVSEAPAGKREVSVERGHLKFAIYLLDNGDCSLEGYKEGANLFTLIKLLIAAGYVLDQTAVIEVIELGSLEVVKFLIEDQGIVLDEDGYKTNPLVAAVRYDHPHLVKYFVEKHSDIRYFGDILFRNALSKGNMQILAILFGRLEPAYRFKRPALLIDEAVGSDKLEVVQFLMEHVPCGQEYLESALSSAACMNNKKIMQAMVLCGARDPRGAMFNLIRRGNLDMVKYLRQTFGTKLDTRAFISAVCNGHYEMVKYCLTMGSMSI